MSNNSKTNLQQFAQFFFCAALAFLLGCFPNKTENAKTALSLRQESLDSIGKWLYQENNYLENNYHQEFYKYYTPQIAQKNIDSAAHLLDIALDRATISYRYDSILVKEALSFMAQYEHKINAKRFLRIHSSLGYSYQYNTDYDRSLMHFQKGLEKAENSEKNVWVGEVYRGIANVYISTSKLDSANQSALHALKISETLGDTLGLNDSYDALSNIYNLMENYEEAMHYQEKSIEISRIIKDSVSFFTGTHNKLTLLQSTKSPKLLEEIDSLLVFYNRWQSKDPIFKLAAKIWTVTKLNRQNKLEAAKSVLDSIAPFVGRPDGLVFEENYYDELAEYEHRKGQGTQYKALFDKKMKEKQTAGELYSAAVYCNLLIKDAALKQDYASAYAYQKNANAIRDSLANKELRTTIADLDKKYQTEKKEARIKQQAAEAVKKNIFIAVLVVGLLALIFFYNLLRKKNNIISQQNELNEHTIAIISHDIKEPLLGVKLLLKKLNTNDPFVAQASNALEGQINAVNSILTNLLKMKKLAFAKTNKNAQADANSVVKNVLQELNSAIQNKELTIQNELHDNLILPIAPEKLQIIIHNLLSNAIKYSFSHQKIRIFKEGKGICIQDFGVGLSPEQRSKLMREVTASQRGTNQERGNGIGLFLVGAMLQGEAVKVIFDSPEVGGTVAIILA